MHKTQIPEDTIADFIKSKFSETPQTIVITSGEFSQALELKFKAKDLILRLNSNNDLGFQKEKIINTKYPHIKAPQILEHGNFDKDTFYAISEKVSGKSLRDLTIQENKDTLNDLFSNMNIIHSTPIAESGFGNWYPNLKGQFISWEERLEYYLELKEWPELLDKYKFIDSNLLDKAYDYYQALIKFLPSERYFLHGDFGRSNIFAGDKQIVGIIDWSEAMYGDFLWDLCWIDFWVEEIDFISEYWNYNKDNKNLDLSNFKERTDLYFIVGAIHHLLFAAKRNNIEDYNEVAKMLEDRLTTH